MSSSAVWFGWDASRPKVGEPNANGMIIHFEWMPPPMMEIRAKRDSGRIIQQNDIVQNNNKSKIE